MTNRPCINIHTLDNQSVIDASKGSPLEVKSHLECGNTLSAEAMEKLAPKTVRISSDFGSLTGSGSGFFVGEDGDMVITNNHVVAGSRVTRVTAVDGEEFNARVVDVDEKDDLALLKVEGMRKDPNRSVSFDDPATIKAGATLLSLGYPGGVDDTVLSLGTSARGGQLFAVQSQADGDAVASLKKFGKEHPDEKAVAEAMLEAPRAGLNMPIFHGNSGGLVADSNLNVVAVAEAVSLNDPTKGFAISADKVQDLMARDQPAFTFNYDTTANIFKHPGKILTEDGLIFAGSALLRRFAAPVYGAVDGWAAYQDFSMAAKNDSYAPRLSFVAHGVTELAGFAGGVMSLFPQTRNYGYGLAAASLLIDMGSTAFNHETTLQSVQNNDGTKRQPLGWGDNFFH